MFIAGLSIAVLVFFTLPVALFIVAFIWYMNSTLGMLVAWLLIMAIAATVKATLAQYRSEQP